MTPTETASILAFLQGTYPRFTPDDIQNQVWARFLAPVGVEDGKAAVERWGQEKEWPPVPAQFLDFCEEAKRRREWEATASNRLEERTACDGGGYIDGPGGYEPCPRCNPVLRDRWKAGHWNYEMRARDMPDDWVRPQGCRPYDPTPVCSFPEGVEIARKASTAELSERGFDLGEIEARWRRVSERYFGSDGARSPRV